MPITNIPFGIPGPLREVTVNYSFEELRIKGCDGTFIFYLDGTEQYTLNRDVYYAYGIECDAADISEVITAVSLTETEEIAGQHRVARDPGATPGEARLLKTDFLMVVGVGRTVTVNGMGALPTNYEAADIGRTVGELTFNTRYGTFSIVTGSTTVLRDISETGQLTDFHNYTLNMEEYVDTVDADAQDHLIDLETEEEAYADTLHSRALNLALANEGVPTNSTTVVNFLTD
jgi:hypothetical protein